MEDKNFTRTDEYILKRLDKLESKVIHEIATLKADAKKEGAKQGSIYAVCLSIFAALIDRYFSHWS